MWQLLVAIIVIVALGAFAGAFGAALWRARTRRLQGALQDARILVDAPRYAPGELDGLPAPVQRYFHGVLPAGQPIITAARIGHEGQFNMAHEGAKWRPFTSEEVVSTRPPGFLWDAHVRAGCGANALVHDAYVDGEGILDASLWGLVPLAHMRGTPEAARDELMRYLAEAAWYPTALLPSQGVVWEPIDDASARATLTDGDTTVSLDFHFDAGGLIERVYCAARNRAGKGTLIAIPWEGRFWRYETRHGVRIPLEGEVSWLLREGPFPYWRARITRVDYECAE